MQVQQGMGSVDAMGGEPDVLTLPALSRLGSLVTCVVSTLVLCALPSTPASGYQGSMSAGWGVRLDDHSAAGAESFTPWTQVLTPALGFVGMPLGTQVEARARGLVEVGSAVPGAVPGSWRRGTAADARVALARTLAVGSVSTQGFLVRSHDLLDDDQASVRANADELRWGASAAGTLGLLEGDYRLRGWRSDAPASESRSLGWGARLMMLRGGAGALFAGARERRLESEREAVLSARVASLGFRRLVSPQLTATLEAGAVDERVGLVREPIRPAASLELASPVGAGRSDFRLRLARELGNEFELELGRSAGGVRGWLNASSSVDIEGAGARAPAVIDRAGLGVVDTLAGATMLGMQASFARERPYRGLPDARTAVTRIGAWVARRIQPWLTCRAGWDLLERRGIEPGAQPDSRRSRLELLLTAEKP